MAGTGILIGGAGTGKTTRLIDIMLKVRDRGVKPHEIGFFTMTVAARMEAAQRAAVAFECNIDELLRYGWMKTGHAAVLAMLDISAKELLTGTTKADRDWLKSNVDANMIGGSDEDADPFAAACGGDIALKLWHAARCRLTGLRTAHRVSERCDERTPSFADCVWYIERYESAKRLDHRTDFTDLLGMYAGWNFHIDGPTEVQPLGEVPQLPVVFIDEAQDLSDLLNSAMIRLASRAKWKYLVGDPFQSIFSFSGSNPDLFQEWESDKQEVLGQSYRCPKPIHELGERILQQCSNYWDRGINPAPHEGVVERMYLNDDWVSKIDPRESWMLIARTNYVASRLSKELTRAGLPWVTTTGTGVWASPIRKKAIAGLLELQDGGIVNVDEWSAIVKNLPSKIGKRKMFVRGTKKRWGEAQDVADDIESLEGIERWGGTVELQNLISSGEWIQYIKHADDFISAAKLYGMESVMDPQVEVGTIHSVKGSEADNVLLFTTLSHQVVNTMQEQGGYDEEMRIIYVAVTRARKRLVILDEQTINKMEIPD